ncbi:MAG: WYL domain-containing protein [Muribaculaceae bacterium]|nr:WYL domain-containing protein [Muribaculaceae bacterium]
MARNILNKYVWLVDTISRYKFITRAKINELWMRNTEISDGNPLPRRTFYNYCRAIEETFDIIISCNLSTYEYYIEQSPEAESGLREWLLDSFAISGTLSNSRELASKIVLENVPSARKFLPIVIDGIRDNFRIKIEYRSFDRVQSRTTSIDPYFVRIFRQRWYVICYDHSRKAVRTYALDRFVSAQILQEHFEQPDFSAADYFAHSFGIYQSKGEPALIKIKAEPETARYIRALPLHTTQQEEIHDAYSIFTYTMYLTPDLVQELLGMGPRIEVLHPQSLRAMMLDALSKTIAIYSPHRK